MAKHANITNTPERRAGAFQQDAAQGRATHPPCLATVAPPLIHAVPVDDEFTRLLARHAHLDHQITALSAGAAAIPDQAERAEQIHMIETVQFWMRARIAALVVAAGERAAA